MGRNKIAVITDSCADISPDLKKKYHIHVIPLTIQFGDTEYADGVDIHPADVYRRQKTEMGKTTLPSGARIEAVLDAVRAEGCTHAIAIMLSSGLSGTYNLMRMMGEQAEGLTVAVFDSRSGSIGIGLSVIQTAHWIEEGWSWDELMRAVPVLLSDTQVLFCIDTLEFLQKGGRIGKISAVAGTLLQIKPILSFAEDGQLTGVSKVRGRKAAVERMVHMIAERVPRGAAFNIGVVHGGAPEEGRALCQSMRKALPDYATLVEGELACTMGVHVGPHLLGVCVQMLTRALEARSGK